MDQCQILMGYFFLNFYPIACKPSVLKFYAKFTAVLPDSLLFFRIYSGFSDNYVDRCRLKDVHAGCSHIRDMNIYRDSD